MEEKFVAKIIDNPNLHYSGERTPEQKALDIMQVTFDVNKSRYHQLDEAGKGQIWLKCINQAVGYLTCGSPGCNKTVYEAMSIVRQLIDNLKVD